MRKTNDTAVKTQRIPETKYVFRVRDKLRPLAGIHGRSCKLGDIVSTPNGPHRVTEVYWSGSDSRGWKADVLLKPVAERPARDVKHGSKHGSKPTGSKPKSKKWRK